ncbi:MAG: glycosyl transferase [Flavobacteriales bacterium]|nr:MAG: glycosyl transferase [Flavobacteriales bacterium]
MSKQAVTIDVRMLNYSGIGIYIQNILPFLIEHFQLILLGNKKELNEFEWAAKTKIISFKANIYSVKEQFLFPKIIPKTKLLWCPHFNIPLFPVKAQNLICTIHDVNHLALKKSVYSLKYGYAKKLISKAVNKSNRIITVSEFSKSEIIKHTNASQNQIEVIPNGIRPDFYKTDKENLSIELPNNYFLFVGNVKPHKNLIVLLKAYLALSSTLQKKFKIVVIGKKEGFVTGDRKIFDFIKKHGLEKSVIFTGYVPNNTISKVYKNAEAFIFPSIYEGFGLPLLEAMSCNTPVICSDIAPFKEVATDAALFFDKNNAISLKEKIERLIHDNDLKSKLILKGKQNILKYSWEKAANKHIELFYSIIKR